jgi:alanyl-tRNA synthetase
MTNRLYYTDPYLRSFDATIRALNRSRRDGRLVVILDRTAFYPTSGGQPFDIGTLGGHRVVEVAEEEDAAGDEAGGGTVAHVIEPGDPGEPSQPGDRAGDSGGRQALNVGEVVHSEIDWDRRFDHMQQHTGQHVLSAAFDRLFDVRTLSFHLGAEVSTVDLAREMTATEIMAAEEAANRVVWEDRAVSIRFVTRDEAGQLPLRKEPAREGTLRLVEIDGWDLSACGGTHVARTGSIGAIAVAAWERFKGGQRVEFLCGGRALRRFRSMRGSLGASVRLLSVLPQELPAAIGRLQADAKEQKRGLLALQGELARCRAAELVATARSISTGRLVLGTVDADASGLKTLAVAVTREPGLIAVLVSTSTPALIVVARSSDQSASSEQLLSALMARFGGRGGGKAELAQAGGLGGAPEEILEAAGRMLA